jgi:hypothetical protein
MQMQRFSRSTIALAMGLAFGAAAMAQNRTHDEYQAKADGIETAYRSDAARCGSFAANAKEVCIAEAKAREKVAKADLEALYKPGDESAYQARDARAEADYAVAKQKCDALAGNTKDTCVAQAQEARTAAKANARLQMKTSDANTVAGDKAALHGKS